MILKLLIFSCLINFGVFGFSFLNPETKIGNLGILSRAPETKDEANEYDRTPTPEMIKNFGYPVEVHKVTTEDGYILELHRIPHGINNSPKDTKAVVYLQHALLCSSADYVYQTPERGLAFILADNGFDVWMPNSRGTNYSRSHVTLDPDKDPAFWDFSWHEMGMYDMPACLDYILEQTKAPNVLYIGFSQGTTQAFVAASRIPDLEKKIKAFFLMAPVAYGVHSESLLMQFAAKIAPVADAAGKAIGFKEFFPSDSLETFATTTLCTMVPTAGPEICKNAIFLAFGYDSEQFNKTLLPRVLGHTPNGCSWKQILHYAQCIRKPRFNEYNDGPDYDLTKIKIPTYLYTGANDWLAALPDVDRLKNELGDALRDDYRVPFEKWNHGDFVLGNDAKELVYDRLVEDMNRVVAEDTDYDGEEINVTE